MRSIIALACLLALSPGLCAKEKETTIPKKISSAVERDFPGSSIVNFDKEGRKDAPEYELNIKTANGTRSIKYDKSAKLIEVEEIITIAQLPKEVAQTLNKHSAGDKILSAEKAETPGVETVYEIVTLGSRGKREFVILENGIITEVAAIKPAKKKDKDGDDEEDDEDNGK